MATSIEDLLNRLTTTDTAAEPIKDGESWPQTIERIHAAPGGAEIDEKTWWYFLDVLPPRFQYGSFFAFADGCEPWTLFWKRDREFFARRLTWDETHELLNTSN